MSEQKYIAVIGDLIGSRQLPERDKVQVRLNYFLVKINSHFTDLIAADFANTIGDEFQGLVKRDFPLQEFLQFFHQHFGWKIKTRFGIGLGDLTTTIKNTAIGLDGACFYHARTALQQAKDQSKFLTFAGFEMNLALTALFDLVFQIESKWSQRQKEIIVLYREVGDQSAIARQLQVTKQSVFDTIKAAKYNLYCAGWQGIQQLFEYSL